MRKKLFLLIVILITFFSFNIVYAEDILVSEENNNTEDLVVDTNKYSYRNENTNYEAFIDDSANLLSEDEKLQLLEDITSLTEYGNVAFVSTNTNDYAVEYFASNYYHSHFSTTSGTIFIVDMSNRKIYIFSDGNNYRVITSSKAYSITDNVYLYARDGDYYNCARNAFKDVKTLLDGGKILEPMRYTSNIFIALTISFLFSFIIVLLKSKTNKITNKSIANNCNIDYNISNVDAKKTGSHKVYSPVESSSGGSSGGGGGGGGGGGSSGGGGGHSF